MQSSRDPDPSPGSPVRSSERLQDTLNRLAAIEQHALTSDFLAPMVRGGVVQVRIAGVICRFQPEPPDFEGWGVFRPASATTARLVRPARLLERKQYLDLLPLVRMIVCGRDGGGWKAIPAHQGDARFRFEGLVDVRLVEEAQLFDVVRVRCDGTQCWYEGPDPRHDPATAAYLRAAIARGDDPAQLDRPGITAEERTAYGLNYWPRVLAEQQARRDRIEERLRAALRHAGAELKEYLERDDVYRVAYEVDGQRHLSVVRKNDLAVQVAGICLSGADHQFDLQSLVGVVREARDSGAVVAVGQDQGGMAEDDYWNVHPPEPEPEPGA
jgi:hypothetical protein